MNLTKKQLKNMIGQDCLNLNKHHFKNSDKQIIKKLTIPQIKLKNKIVIITIYETPPSQNVWKKFVPFKQRKIKRYWQALIKNLFHSLTINEQVYIKRFLVSGTVKPKVDLTWYFDNCHIHDKDNYAYFKAIPDGLSLSGLIIDDNSRATEFVYNEPVEECNSRKTIIEIKY